MDRGIVERVRDGDLVRHVAGFRIDVAGKAGQFASRRVGDDTARGTGHAALLAALVGDDEAAGAPVERAGDTLQAEIVAGCAGSPPVYTSSGLVDDSLMRSPVYVSPNSALASAGWPSGAS